MTTELNEAAIQVALATKGGLEKKIEAYLNALPVMKVEFYKDEFGNHRWTGRDGRNGRVVAASTEGYKRKSAARHNLTMQTGYRHEIVVA